jgi:hypothetical protein
MNTPKTTAIDWLIEQMKELDRNGFNLQVSKLNELGMQAREIEREQIIEAHHQGEMNVLEGIFETELTEARNDKEDATMYYDKTYGKSE